MYHNGLTLIDLKPTSDCKWKSDRKTRSKAYDSLSNKTKYWPRRGEKEGENTFQEQVLNRTVSPKILLLHAYWTPLSPDSNPIESCSKQPPWGIPSLTPLPSPRPPPPPPRFPAWATPLPLFLPARPIPSLLQRSKQTGQKVERLRHTSARFNFNTPQFNPWCHQQYKRQQTVTVQSWKG